MTLAVLVVLGLLVLGAVSLWGAMSTPSQGALPGGGLSDSPAVQPTAASRRPPQGASRSGRAPARRPVPGSPTLVLRVTGPATKVFVRATNGDVVFNGVLQTGAERRYNYRRIDLVVYNAGAVQVIVNGVPQKRGLAGERKTYQIRKAR